MTMSACPSDTLAIAVAQLNSSLGDIVGNAGKVRRARVEAARQGADLIGFPELFIAGYPPEDLVLKPAFQAACRAMIETLARETAEPGPAQVHSPRDTALKRLPPIDLRKAAYPRH